MISEFPVPDILKQCRKEDYEIVVLSTMSDDAEKSIKAMTGETNGEFVKMEILGELKKSNLSTVVAKNAGLK